MEARTSYAYVQSEPFAGAIATPEPRATAANISPASESPASNFDQEVFGHFEFFSGHALVLCTLHHARFSHNSMVSGSVVELAADNSRFLGSAGMSILNILVGDGWCQVVVNIGWQSDLRFQVSLIWTPGST
ncbi:MAG TPA: hypothetical protein VF447_04055 [Terriglobales bacterium]